MLIEPVTQENILQAAAIHAESWRESHREICSAEFLALHTTERQKVMLESAMEQGTRLYLLTDGEPVGLVGINGSRIEHLYVRPKEQNKGYGTRLLAFAVGQCTGAPSLWILSTNSGARRLYERNGFRPTGEIIRHSGGLYELQLAFSQAQNDFAPDGCSVP